MNQLRRLLTSLAPHGVQFARLGDVIQLKFGTRVTKQADSGSQYPVYGGGGESFRVDQFNRENDYVVSRFAMSAKCVRKVHGKFWLLDSGFTFEVVGGVALKDYVAYFLFELQPEIYACSSQGAQKNLKTEEFKKFKIPLPPLEVQREIVRILDNFTDLEAELEAELDLRNAQVDHYRFSALELSRDSFESFPLEDVFDIRTGYTPAKSNSTNWIDGSVPWIRLEDIRERGRVLDGSLQSVSAEAVKNGRLFPPGSLLISTIATIGEHALVRVPHLANQQFVSLTLNSKFEQLLDQQYLFHYAFELGEWCRRNTTGSSLPMVRMVDFKKVAVPIPPLGVQQAVAESLDGFDRLIANLKAELAARRKQYEYYRDKLLTFEEAPA